MLKSKLNVKIVHISKNELKIIFKINLFTIIFKIKLIQYCLWTQLLKQQLM